MTISSTTRIAGPFVGSGTASTFPFTFKVFAATDLDVVRLTTSSGLEATLVLNSDYSVTLNGDQNSNPGGSVTLSAGALATGFTLVITSDIANLQPTDLTNQGGFYPEVITDALDRATIQIQQMSEDVGRSLKAPLSDGTPDMELPAAAQRANSFLAFDASGIPYVVPSSGSGSPVGSTSAALVSYTQGGAGSITSNAQAKMREFVSVKDFGAVGDGTTDDIAAFNLATTYCEANDIHQLHIPPGRYHLSSHWRAPSPAFAGGVDPGNYQPCIVKGYGAILDNTVWFANSSGAEGIRVKDSPDVGFVITRGIGGSFYNLIAEGCVHGFYVGVTSRQDVTVASSTGFSVGQLVTGGTSGATGTIDAISGNVLKLVGCNKTKALGTSASQWTQANTIFNVAETVTSSTGSSSVSSVSLPYGGNAQVTRTSFVNCIAYNNDMHGWFMDGVCTANQSWFNANTLTGCAGIANANGSGYRVGYGNGPSGGNEHNYNTFAGFNVEQNSSAAGSCPFDDQTGRQNTYLGGHFVTADTAQLCFRAADSVNFIYGGRYVGTQDLTGVASYVYNDDTTAVVGFRAPLFETSGSGSGLKLTSTPTASDVNTLDCYVQGTFTPVISPATNSFTSVTYAFQTGTYTRIGNTVTISIRIRTDAITVGTASGLISITGLPAEILPSGGIATDSSLSITANSFNANGPLHARINSTGIVTFYRTAIGGNITQNTVTDLATGATANTMHITGTYIL
jgi:hypothetical protein